MTNQELMSTLAGLRQMLYSVPFQGDQMMIVSQCVAVLDVTMQKLNQGAGDATPAKK